MIIKIFEGTPNERVIGEYFPYQFLFKKRVSLSKHLYKKENAWGIDARFFTDVLLPQNCLIEIYDKEEKKTYKISAREFKAKGFYFHFSNDTDNKAQIFLSRRYFYKI